MLDRPNHWFDLTGSDRPRESRYVIDKLLGLGLIESDGAEPWVAGTGRVVTRERYRVIATEAERLNAAHDHLYWVINDPESVRVGFEEMRERWATVRVKSAGANGRFPGTP